MSRDEFLGKLRRSLRALPQAEVDQAMTYYQEYLDDADDEAAAIASLGSPREVAGRIVAELAALPRDAAGAKRGTARSAWVVALAVLASPVAVVIGLVAVVLVVALVAVLASVGVTAVVLLPGGLMYVALGLFAIPQSFPVGLDLVGTGLICAGLSVPLIFGAIWLWRKGFTALTRLFGKYLTKEGK